MPNLTNYPNIRPSLFLDFSNSGRVDPRIEFTRATTATRVNSKGIIEVVPAGVPRIDYDPVTRECLGLLVESAGTNLAVQSEFATGLPTANGGTVTPTAFPGFAGGLLFSSGGGTTFAYRAPALSAAGTPHTFSVLIRMDDGGAPVISSTATSGFDLALIVAGASGQSALRHLGGGLYLAWATHNTPVSGSSWGVVKYAGQSARGFKVTGYQIEASSFPTSYIPTTTAEVTRASDLAQMTGMNFSGWYDPSEGTFICEFLEKETPAAVASTYLGLILNAGTDRLLLYRLTAGPQMQVSTGGANQVQTSIPGLGGLARKLAVAYKTDDFVVCQNGQGVSSDLLGVVPAVDTVRFGSVTPVSGALNGHVRSVAYYPVRLTNAQLQALTAK